MAVRALDEHAIHSVIQFPDSGRATANMSEKIRTINA
jgi:hypothetical protein